MRRREFLAGIGAASVWPLSVLAQQSEQRVEHKRIVILHSFGREFRPWNEYAKAVRSELHRQSPWTLDVQEHSLVTARSTDPRAELTFVLREVDSARVHEQRREIYRVWTRDLTPQPVIP